MASKLIIVESPTKARTLGRFLGSGFQILASYGHIRDLPAKKLGVDVKNKFRPQYEYIKNKNKVLKTILAAAKESQEIILATDPDREGEAIAYHLNVLLNDRLKKKNIHVKRITFHEITPEAIDQALKKASKINLDLFYAQQARRILDRLVGYKLSPLLWYKVRRGLSAGRVQSVVVRLIYQREEEIKAFQPQEYWLVKADFKKGNISCPNFDLVKIDKKKPEIGSRKELEKIISLLKGSRYVIDGIRRKKIKSHSLPPLTTSTLQQLASVRYGFGAYKTMRAAQSLYEKGLITYHRTDSVNLAKAAIGEMRKYIKSQYGLDYLPEKANFFKTKSKLAQEAHEAIRPTKIALKPEADRIVKLTRDEKKIYDLVWCRALMSQMASWLGEQVSIDVKGRSDSSQFIFRRRGLRTLFLGWKKLSWSAKEDVEIPFIQKVSQSDDLALSKLNPEQKFTSPPKRYTDASLIKTLEEMGIGRPSTYAPILQKIQERRYVEKENRSFRLTNLGKAVTEFLVKYFPKIMDYKFTANMEKGLDSIAQSDLDWIKLVSEFWQWFEPLIVQVKDKAERVKIETEKIGEKCPKCGGELVVRIGRYGKFISCSNYPDCDYKRDYVQKTKYNCPECGGDVIIRKTKKGRKYYACSNYPKCKWMSWRKPTTGTPSGQISTTKEKK